MTGPGKTSLWVRACVGGNAGRSRAEERREDWAWCKKSPFGLGRGQRGS